MTSIPQLRKDINDLQAEIRRLKNELEREKNKSPIVKEVVKEVPKQVVKVVEVEGKTKVVKEPAPPPVVVTKVVEKDVPGPERIVFRDVEKVVYRDNPKHIEMIRNLQGKQ